MKQERNMEMTGRAADTLRRLRAEKPLVDCITNRVTINDCANILLAAGGSPIMAEDEREIEDIVRISQGLVLNLGILSQKVTASMITAGKAAKALGIPVVFDPVGAGASGLRDRLARMILREVQPDVIRGNFSEIKSLSGTAVQSAAWMPLRRTPSQRKIWTPAGSWFEGWQSNAGAWSVPPGP